MRVWNTTALYPAYGISHASIAERLTRENWLQKAVVRQGLASIYLYWWKEAWDRYGPQGGFHQTPSPEQARTAQPAPKSNPRRRPVVEN
jgi:hypothetical protein